MSGAAAPVRHIVLVVFDTLRRDALGCYGTPPSWGPIATPNLDAFARESVRFERAYPAIAQRIDEALARDVETCARALVDLGVELFGMGEQGVPPRALAAVRNRLGW